ncbi:4Fe-4S dicluster domain-containing protein [Microbulbifer taiwanensis]
MFDEHTRTVSYDACRGEPRANRRKGDANSGDCIDCGLCVQVCPVGIDIRDGLQAACIDCGACIDACDSVMKRVDRPAGLIRFTAEAELQGGGSRFLRPRLAGYGAVMLVAFSAVLYGFTDTTQLLIEIRRDRGALFTRLDEHTVCNNYRVKVEGFVEGQQLVDVSIAGDDQFELFGSGQIDLAENNASWLPYRICARDLKRPSAKVTFNFSAGSVAASKASTFLAHSL